MYNVLSNVVSGVGAYGFFDGIALRRLQRSGGIKDHRALSLLFLLSAIWAICHGAIFLDSSHVSLVVGGGIRIICVPGADLLGYSVLLESGRGVVFAFFPSFLGRLFLSP